MTPAFWDSSALVPLCVQQRASPTVRRLARHYGIVVWWCTAVEVRSAFARLMRVRELTRAGQVLAEKSLEQMENRWIEVQPTEALRSEAEGLLTRFPLRAADALQLAAAMTWALDRPQGRVFICGDTQLLEAARGLGFQAEEA